MKYIILIMLTAFSIANVQSQETEELTTAQEVTTLEELADQGDVDAQSDLGEMYYYGNNIITQDLESAAYWYEQAAVRGDADAQYSLGFMYEYGEYLYENLAVAIFWYTQAAKQGDQRAIINLRDIYLTEGDLETSNYWLHQLNKPLPLVNNRTLQHLNKPPAPIHE